MALTREQYRKMLSLVFDEHLYLSDVILFAFRMTRSLTRQDSQDPKLQEEYKKCLSCLKMARRHSDNIEFWRPKRPGKGNKK